MGEGWKIKTRALLSADLHKICVWVIAVRRLLSFAGNKDCFLNGLVHAQTNLKSYSVIQVSVVIRSASSLFGISTWGEQCSSSNIDLFTWYEDTSSWKGDQVETTAPAKAKIYTRYLSNNPWFCCLTERDFCWFFEKGGCGVETTIQARSCLVIINYWIAWLFRPTIASWFILYKSFAFAQNVLYSSCSFYVILCFMLMGNLWVWYATQITKKG